MEAILYGLQRSVYTRIACLALEEKGVAHVLREVDIFGPAGVPADYRLHHPFGRIPTLRHGDFWLYETTAITRYVDEAFEGPALQPTDPVARARMNQIVGVLDSYAYRPMVWGVFVERVLAARDGARSDEAKINRAIADSDNCLAALSDICRCEPFLVGSRITLADLHAYPMLRCLALAPEGAQLLRARPQLDRWLRAMRARESVQRTESPYER